MHAGDKRGAPAPGLPPRQQEGVPIEPPVPRGERVAWPRRAPVAVADAAVATSNSAAAHTAATAITARCGTAVERVQLLGLSRKPVALSLRASVDEAGVLPRGMARNFSAAVEGYPIEEMAALKARGRPGGPLVPSELSRYGRAVMADTAMRLLAWLPVAARGVAQAEGLLVRDAGGAPVPTRVAVVPMPNGRGREGTAGVCYDSRVGDMLLLAPGGELPAYVTAAAADVAVELRVFPGALGVAPGAPHSKSREGSTVQAVVDAAAAAQAAGFRVRGAGGGGSGAGDAAAAAAGAEAGSSSASSAAAPVSATDAAALDALRSFLDDAPGGSLLLVVDDDGSRLFSAYGALKALHAALPGSTWAPGISAGGNAAVYDAAGGASSAARPRGRLSVTALFAHGPAHYNASLRAYRERVAALGSIALTGGGGGSLLAQLAGFSSLGATGGGGSSSFIVRARVAALVDSLRAAAKGAGAGAGAGGAASRNVRTGLEFVAGELEKLHARGAYHSALLLPEPAAVCAAAVSLLTSVQRHAPLLLPGLALPHAPGCLRLDDLPLAVDAHSHAAIYALVGPAPTDGAYRRYLADAAAAGGGGGGKGSGSGSSSSSSSSAAATAPAANTPAGQIRAHGEAVERTKARPTYVGQTAQAGGPAARSEQHKTVGGSPVATFLMEHGATVRVVADDDAVLAAAAAARLMHATTLNVLEAATVVLLQSAHPVGGNLAPIGALPGGSCTGMRFPVVGAVAEVRESAFRMCASNNGAAAVTRPQWEEEIAFMRASRISAMRQWLVDAFPSDTPVYRRVAPAAVAGAAHGAGAGAGAGAGGVPRGLLPPWADTGVMERVDDPTVNEIISQLAVQARWTLTPRGAAFAAAPTATVLASTRQKQSQSMTAATVSKQEAGQGLGAGPSQSAVLACAMFMSPDGHPATIPWRAINGGGGLSARFHFGGRSALVMMHHAGLIRLDEEADAAAAGGAGLAGEAGEQAAPPPLPGARRHAFDLPLGDLPADTVLRLAAVAGNASGVGQMNRLARAWASKFPDSPPIVTAEVTYAALLAVWHAAGPVR
jgi:hypothetical protein